MHPIHFDADYAVERNRLTVFFRLILGIPWLIVLYVWAILAYVAVIISWFAMLVTGRHPEGIYDFIASFLRFSGRTGAWLALVTDEWPAFSGGDDDAYPVQVAVDPPQPSYHRAKTLFKLVLYFPQGVLSYGLNFVLQGAAFVSWWRILFTGKQSATMHDALRSTLAYQLRSTGFLLLLTEVHPRLLDLPEQVYPADAPALPPPSAPAAIEEPVVPRPEPPAERPGWEQPPPAPE